MVRRAFFPLDVQCGGVQDCDRRSTRECSMLGLCPTFTANPNHVICKQICHTPLYPPCDSSDMLPSTQTANMAFSGGLNERMGELRFPNVRSPNEEFPYSGYTSPPRGQNSFFSSFQQSSNDTRSSLQRRFTTDSSRGSVSAFGSQYSQMKPDYSAAVSIDLHFV